MNILLIHNYYQIQGGEDAVVENEKKMLEHRGHSVATFFCYNDDIVQYNNLDRLLLIPRILYNGKILKQIKKIIVDKKIDIVHVHNFWPLISPSVFFLFNKLKIPYLQTVHNYRYLAANAMLYKEDINPLENRLNIRSRKLNSFRNSYLLTFVYWLTGRFVRLSGVINKGSGGLQVLNRFSYSIHAHIFSEDRLFIRGNYLPASIIEKMGNKEKENYYLYLGRISKEKGIETLIKAFQELRSDSILKIAGDGPLTEELRSRYKGNEFIEFAGFISGDKKQQMIAKAKAIVVPSEWQEPFPISFLEAYFCYTPVIASCIGGLSDMVENLETGLLFESGDVSDLKSKLQWCENHPEKLKKMGMTARKYAEEHFSEESSYRRLMEIYNELLLRVKILDL